MRDVGLCCQAACVRDTRLVNVHADTPAPDLPRRLYEYASIAASQVPQHVALPQS